MGRRHWGPVQHPLFSSPLLAADLGGQGAPATIPTPSSQSLPPLPWRAEHRHGPLGLARISSPPAAPAGHGRSRLGATAASTAAGSLPASGQRRPRALQSMSHHWPRPGLRLCTAQAGTAVQAPAPAAYGRSSPSGSASAPRRAPAPRVCEAAAEPATSRAQSPSRPLPPPPSRPARLPPARLPAPLHPGREVELGTALVPLGGDPEHRSKSQEPPLLSSYYPRPGYTGRPPPWPFPLPLSHPSPRPGPLPNSLPNLIQTPVPTLPPRKSRLEKCLHQCLLPWAFAPPDPSSSRQDPQVAPCGPPFPLRSGRSPPLPLWPKPQSGQPLWPQLTVEVGLWRGPVEVEGNGTLGLL